MAAMMTIPAALTPAEVEHLMKSGAGIKLLDVRSPAEFESVHIPGSYNVPLDLIADHREELQGVGEPVVLVCRSGNRAREAELILRESGLPRVHVLKGGLQAWESAGLAVNRGRQRWSLERQVRAIAGMLVLLGTLGSLLIWPPLIFLAVFVGGGLLFAGVTDFCLMGKLLLRLPYNQGATCDIASVLARLRTDAAQPSA